MSPGTLGFYDDAARGPLPARVLADHGEHVVLEGLTEPLYCEGFTREWTDVVDSEDFRPFEVLTAAERLVLLAAVLASSP